MTIWRRCTCLPARPSTTWCITCSWICPQNHEDIKQSLSCSTTFSSTWGKTLEDSPFWSHFWSDLSWPMHSVPCGWLPSALWRRHHQWVWQGVSAAAPSHQIEAEGVYRKTEREILSKHLLSDVTDTTWPHLWDRWQWPSMMVTIFGHNDSTIFFTKSN